MCPFEFRWNFVPGDLDECILSVAPDYKSKTIFAKMDTSHMSYYGPHERVFVNNRRRSASINTAKTNNCFDLNRNLLQQNFNERNLHTIKHDSNYLLGSSIVNVNFVNNVANPNRSFEGCRNVPIPNFCHSRGNWPNVKSEPVSQDNPNVASSYGCYEQAFPFDNYNYYTYNKEAVRPSKNNLNINDRIISHRSYQRTLWPSVRDHKDHSLPILTKNYLADSPTNPIPNLNELNPNTFARAETACNGRKLQHSKEEPRKSKIDEYLEGLKNNARRDKSPKNVKITIGKPVNEFTAMFPDPVEKELEKWHNSHNSSLKWERVKHGLYSVDGSIVHLLKVNGGLYVEGHGFKKYKGKITILKFVEETESRAARERTNENG